MHTGFYWSEGMRSGQAIDQVLGSDIN